MSPGVLSWQNCSRGPKWVGFDWDSESHGGRTAVGARRHDRLHSGFWENESPSPPVRNTSLPRVSVAPFLPGVSVAPFTIRLQWRMRDYVLFKAANGHNFKNVKQQQKLRDFEKHPFFKLSFPGFARRLSD